MAEALIVLALGLMVLATLLIIRSAPVAGPAVLGIVALAVATACLVAASNMPHGGGDLEDLGALILVMFGYVHLLLGLVLLVVSRSNRNEQRRGDSVEVRDDARSRLG